MPSVLTGNSSESILGLTNKLIEENLKQDKLDEAMHYILKIQEVDQF